jgi:tRNA nucleotidyltransferase (CCA-adding enzyme)
LKAKVLTTPLSSLETLLDDPLRVLRGIRFAARFNFKLDQHFVKAAQDDKIKVSLLDIQFDNFYFED